MSHDRRQLTWSKGIREWAGLGAEQSNEEIAARDEGGDDLVTIGGATVYVARRWRVLDRVFPHGERMPAVPR